MIPSEVLANIKQALADGELNRKVMVNDHIVTPFERNRYIVPYDNRKKKLRNKLKRTVATTIVNNITRKVRRNTTYVGLENLEGIRQTGAILTANHFSPFDSLIVRSVTNKIGKRRKLSIVVAESNIFMKGLIGWLLKSVNTMPFTNDLSYIEKNFNPAISYRLQKKHIVLFYPEQEMWLGYTKPRPLKPGAYHYAAKYQVPIIPTFITMKKVDEVLKYTIHIFPLIYPDPQKTVKENKEYMAQLDFKYKKDCYETVYGHPLTYEFSEDDIVF